MIDWTVWEVHAENKHIQHTQTQAYTTQKHKNTVHKTHRAKTHKHKQKTQAQAHKQKQIKTKKALGNTNTTPHHSITCSLRFRPASRRALAPRQLKDEMHTHTQAGRQDQTYNQRKRTSHSIRETCKHPRCLRNRRRNPLRAPPPRC